MHRSGNWRRITIPSLPTNFTLSPFAMALQILAQHAHVLLRTVIPPTPAPVVVTPAPVVTVTPPPVSGAVRNDVSLAVIATESLPPIWYGVPIYRRCSTCPFTIASIPTYDAIPSRCSMILQILAQHPLVLLCTVVMPRTPAPVIVTPAPVVMVTPPPVSGAVRDEVCLAVDATTSSQSPQKTARSSNASSMQHTSIHRR